MIDKKLCEAQLDVMTSELRRKQKALEEYLEAHGVKLKKHNWMMPRADFIRLCVDKIERADRCR